MVAFGEDLPVLQVSDAVLDSGAETGDCFVESFLPATSGLIGGFLDRSYRGGRGVECPAFSWTVVKNLSLFEHVRQNLYYAGFDSLVKSLKNKSLRRFLRGLGR